MNLVTDFEPLTNGNELTLEILNREGLGYASFAIDITQADIDKGCANHGSSCPAALAVKRRIGPAVEDVIVTCFVIAIYTPYERFMSRTPEALVGWIRSYDHNLPVKPEKFWLNKFKEERWS